MNNQWKKLIFSFKSLIISTWESIFNISMTGMKGRRLKKRVGVLIVGNLKDLKEFVVEVVKLKLGVKYCHLLVKKANAINIGTKRIILIGKVVFTQLGNFLGIVLSIKIGVKEYINKMIIRVKENVRNVVDKFMPTIIQFYFQNCLGNIILQHMSKVGFVKNYGKPKDKYYVRQSMMLRID